ncbi:MAG: Glycosyl transferase family 2 [Candidatus Pacebacteria bacterium GW2011_GWB1_47_8]|nr:MAG: Glycosyl transferase family 2 [Candidatus Pacebacteria bacterium GW2011_GWA1_46_10]KKU84426.1 MAG: Glycosyl transferase family 2 [Candidatus Pacebacteria bacterium GW2011_GWB1_47_8]
MILSIIIVSYNTKDITLQTLRSAVADLRQSKLLPKTEFFVVDNNSQDGSVTAVKQYLQKAKVHHTVIANKDNRGFGAANNQGIKKSRGKYLILLNSDTITQPGAFKTLVETFEKRPIDEHTAHLSSYHRQKTDRLGIIAPILLNTDLSLQAQGGNFPSLLALTVHLLFLDDLPVIGPLLPSTQHTGRNVKLHLTETKLTPIDWLGGTAMMIRREVIDEIGLFDENIFMYGEDIEYCFRARNHHWDIAIQPKAKIVHLANASAGSENALTGEIKGYVYLWSKFKPFWQRPVAKMILWLGSFLRMILFATVAYNPRKAGIYSRILWKIPGF